MRRGELGEYIERNCEASNPDANGKPAEAEEVISRHQATQETPERNDAAGKKEDRPPAVRVGQGTPEQRTGQHPQKH